MSDLVIPIPFRCINWYDNPFSGTEKKAVVIDVDYVRNSATIILLSESGVHLEIGVASIVDTGISRFSVLTLDMLHRKIKSVVSSGRPAMLDKPSLSALIRKLNNPSRIYPCSIYTLKGVLLQVKEQSAIINIPSEQDDLTITALVGNTVKEWKPNTDMQVTFSSRDGFVTVGVLENKT